LEKSQNCCSVCTSEFVAFSKAHDRFQALGCDLLALSVDSLFSHIAWVRSIRERFGVTVPFPITEDPSMAIAAAYGMIHPDAADSSTVRATFVIDPDGLIRAMVWYPMSTGRSVEEILRLVEALQTSDREAVSTPEGWRHGDPVIEPPPSRFKRPARAVPRLQPGGREPLWESTVGDQRRLNLHLVGKSEADFVALREALDRTLPMPKLILHALQVNVRGGRLPEPEGNGRRYLKFPLDALAGAAWE
jgi:alkyl hydroperoxide reductase subunit AhpC